MSAAPIVEPVTRLHGALLAVRELVLNGWTTGCYCRLQAGPGASVGSPVALASKYHLQPGWRARIAYCVAGACDVIAAELSLDVDELRACLEVELDPREAGIDDGFRLERWNDQPGRTLDDVCTLVERAIATQERTR